MVSEMLHVTWLKTQLLRIPVPVYNNIVCVFFLLQVIPYCTQVTVIHVATYPLNETVQRV